MDESEDRLMIRAAKTLDPSSPEVEGAPVVYFVTNGERVKIGHSARIRQRVGSLSLRYSNVRLLLSGSLTLERALHRHFNKVRVGTTEWFDLAGPVQAFIDARLQGLPPAGLDAPVAASAPAPVAVAVPPQPDVLYPDGTFVLSNHWPALYAVLVSMGSATKDELRDNGPYDSRDTVRRALDTWCRHGVLSRPDGRTTRYYLPGEFS